MKFRILTLLFALLFLSGCVGVSSKGIFGTGVSVALDPRSLGTQIDDSIMQKNLSARLVIMDKKYFLSIKSKVLDGRIFLTGKVDNPEEKLKITKLAWETDGVRSVENIIKVDDQSSWKDKATDLLISSQFKVAIIANKAIKSNNFSFTTINQNLYIFGIARDEEERKSVINEAKKVQYVKEVTPSIFLIKDLSNNQRITN